MRTCDAPNENVFACSDPCAFLHILRQTSVIRGTITPRMRAESDGGSRAEYQICSIAVSATSDSKTNAERKMMTLLITMSISESLMSHAHVSEYVTGNALTDTMMFPGSPETRILRLTQHWVKKSRKCEAEVEIIVVPRSFIVARLTISKAGIVPQETCSC